MVPKVIFFIIPSINLIHLLLDYIVVYFKKVIFVKYFYLSLKILFSISLISCSSLDLDKEEDKLQAEFAKFYFKEMRIWVKEKA